MIKDSFRGQIGDEPNDSLMSALDFGVICYGPTAL